MLLQSALLATGARLVIHQESTPGIIIAAAQVDRAGRRIVHASARLFDGAGVVLASATAVFAVV